MIIPIISFMILMSNFENCIYCCYQPVILIIWQTKEKLKSIFIEIIIVIYGLFKQVRLPARRVSSPLTPIIRPEGITILLRQGFNN